MLASLLFYVLGTVAVVTAIMVITVRNPVHSALCLVGTLIAVAGLFLNLGAEFMAAVQILVYVGGIMVLFLFVVMLVSVEQLKRMPIAAGNWKTSAILGIVLAVELSVFSSRGLLELKAKGTPTPPGLTGNTAQVGWALYSKYMLPFEVASVLLLVAIVGAVIYTRKNETD